MSESAQKAPIGTRQLFLWVAVIALIIVGIVAIIVGCITTNAVSSCKVECQDASKAVLLHEQDILVQSQLKLNQ